MNWNVQPLHYYQKKAAEVRANWKPLAQQTLNTFATLQRQCHLSNKLNILFELSCEVDE